MRLFYSLLILLKSVPEKEGQGKKNALFMCIHFTKPLALLRVGTGDRTETLSPIRVFTARDSAVVVCLPVRRDCVALTYRVWFRVRATRKASREGGVVVE